MKRFWFGAVLTIVLWSGGWLLGIELQLGVGTPGLRWVFDAYQLKIGAANKAPGSRVLVVAGSNAMFGIDSGQLESFWHRPVINLGVNAGLGLPYVLDVSKRVARAGDVILMPMEYGMYLNDGSANAQIIDYVIARDADYWRRLAVFKRLEFALGMTPERWLQGLQQLPDVAVTSGVYGAHHLDARGDQTHSAATNQTADNKAAVRDAEVRHYGARAAKEKGGWKSIREFAQWAQRTGVCVIAVPTVLMYRDAYDQDPQEAAFYASVPGRISSLGIPYVGLPRDFMYPSAWFFDTDHHLQDWARVRHTARLIELLKPDPLAYCGNQ